MHYLSLIHGTTEIPLHGLSAPDLKTWARRGKITSDPPAAVETIDLLLEGAPAVIQARLVEMARLLGDIARPDSGAVFLNLVPYKGASSFSARLTGGSLDLLPDRTEDLGAGRVGAQLVLRRVNAWEGELAPLPLSNSGGSAPAEGLVVFNHNDGSPHENFAEVDSAGVLGDLPASVLLIVENDQPGGAALGDLWVAHSQEGLYPIPNQSLEGEAGGGTPLTSAGASGGSFARVTAASPANGAALLSWNLSGDVLSDWTPGPLCPLLRLATAPAYLDLWLYWKVTAGGASWETAKTLLTGGLVQPLAPVDLAPGIAWGTPASPTLELRCKGPGASYTLDIDAIQFLPTDGYRLYKAFHPLPLGAALYDEAGEVYGRTASGQRLTTHLRLGPPPEVIPGQAQRFIFMHDGAASHPLRVRMMYQPRWSAM